MEEEKNKPHESRETGGQAHESASGQPTQEDKLWALLSYFGILVLIPLLGKKEFAFIHFHAKQGLVLLAGWVVSPFPVLGWAIGLITFVLSIVGIVYALSGEKKKLPIVGDLAEKINI